ncbi:MAG TPA: cupin domain-containing protein [Acidimicrobiia bacterium]|nr:cupin domain-containing protein [Acidimicrobiia bacterium]
MAEESHEKLVADLAKDIDGTELSSLVFDLSKYQQFDAEAATVVLTYVTGQLGIVVWNLEPGQENDYHVHPTTEHLHIVLEGECEYSIGDLPPQTVKAGQAAMIPAQVPHGIRNRTDRRASYIAITSPGPYEKILVDRPAASA